ncbi:hypothetical protein KA405_03750 [Patescibacteria group bacterium]|nr:hypothetical protein [Patescibacteria group bacterium]
MKTEIEYYSTFEGLYIYGFENRTAWICFNKKTEEVIHYLQFENEEVNCDNQYTLQEFEYNKNGNVKFVKMKHCTTGKIITIYSRKNNNSIKVDIMMEPPNSWSGEMIGYIKPFIADIIPTYLQFIGKEVTLEFDSVVNQFTPNLFLNGKLKGIVITIQEKYHGAPPSLLVYLPKFHRTILLCHRKRFDDVIDALFSENKKSCQFIYRRKIKITE